MHRWCTELETRNKGTKGRILKSQVLEVSKNECQIKNNQVEKIWLQEKLLFEQDYLLRDFKLILLCSPFSNLPKYNLFKHIPHCYLLVFSQCNYHHISKRSEKKGFRRLCPQEPLSGLKAQATSQAGLTGEVQKPQRKGDRWEATPVDGRLSSLDLSLQEHLHVLS